MEPYLSTQNPQLASILQNLAQFTQPANPGQGQQKIGPVLPAPSTAAYTSPATVQPRSSSLAAPSLDPRRRSTTPQPDSSGISEWSPAVKYVMNVLSKNAESSSKIKRLIKNQHDNEKQWWAGREALVAKHNGRVESKKKADDLLRSLGAANGHGAKDLMSTAVEERIELERYDKKVYAALGQMAAAIDRDLTMLKVPFFAIKHDLVQKTKGSDGVLTKAQLIELQKKMLQLLEDSFGD
jgi:Protein of unknown function (DUF2458)